MIKLEELSDEELALRVTPENGDDAFEVLYNRHIHKILFRVKSHLSPEHDAEFVCQDVMIKFYENLRYGKFNPKLGKVVTYLWVMTSNAMIDSMRRVGSVSRRRHQLTDIYAIEEEHREVQDFKLLREAVSSLPEKYRTIVEMRLKGLEHHEVARQLGGINDNTSRWRYMKAVELIRRYMVGHRSQHTY